MTRCRAPSDGRRYVGGDGHPAAGAGCPTLRRRIDEAPIRLISAVSVLEAGILATSRGGREAADALDALLLAAALEVVPFDNEQAAVARLAFARFGKRRHPANLNFGDCAVYALAATRALPLLFKGTDFAATDLASCIAPG